MSDPVSWFMIEPGWRVESSDGSDVGRVEEVTGDSNADIFDGLAIAFSALGAQHYVPAEQVGTITEGTVQLKLDRAGIEHELNPSSKPHHTGLTRRVAEWFGRTGRR
jgi:hypothetical protein